MQFFSLQFSVIQLNSFQFTGSVTIRIHVDYLYRRCSQAGQFATVGVGIPVEKCKERATERETERERGKERENYKGKGVNAIKHGEERSGEEKKGKHSTKNLKSKREPVMFL